ELLDGGARVIGEPSWLRQPDAAAFRASYPKAASDAAVTSGSTTLVCTVGDGGRLKDCKTEETTPAGLGFDTAALQLASDFQSRTWTDDGRPILGGTVRVLVLYLVDPSAGPAATKD